MKTASPVFQVPDSVPVPRRRSRRLDSASKGAVLCRVLCVALLGAAPARAQAPLDFDMPRDTAVVPPVFSVADVEGWLGELNRRLEASPTARDAATALDAFARRLQRGRLTPALEQAALAGLERWTHRRPEFAAAVAAARTVIARFTVGKPAPDIDGLDLSGKPLRLREFRGKVVVLSFSGEWCGICRSEYPYQRFLLELYESWPFELLSVESGRDAAAVRAAKATNGLNHRSWWDSGGKTQFGPIATAWQVTGWPTTYLIDANGIIRYVDLRKEDLLKAVRFLVGEAADAR